MSLCLSIMSILVLRDYLWRILLPYSLVSCPMYNCGRNSQLPTYNLYLNILMYLKSNHFSDKNHYLSSLPSPTPCLIILVLLSNGPQLIEQDSLSVHVCKSRRYSWHLLHLKKHIKQNTSFSKFHLRNCSSICLFFSTSKTPHQFIII